MKKSLLLLVTCFLFGVSPYGFSQETVEITTYFPSPNGAFDRLIANHIGIGSNSSPQSFADTLRGVLNFGPRATFPFGIGCTGNTTPCPGEFFYHGVLKTLYFYNGTRWMPAFGTARYVPYGPSSGVYTCDETNPFGFPGAQKVNVVDQNKNPADFSNPPGVGYLVCL
jgi:hypothetical protein